MGKRGDDGPQIACRMTTSQWKPHVSVPTYFVAQRGRRGCFATLNDAINFAEPYSRIEVAGGRYFENVIVNKPVEISCNTEDDVAAEFTSRGVTFTLRAAEAYIEGLRIRTSEPKTVCLSIESGRPVVTRCEIDSVTVANDAAPVVRDNKICRGKLHGLHVFGHASGTYDANIVEHHQGFCIVVESDRAPEFTNNRISQGAQGQVIIRANSSLTTVVNPTFVQNNIRDDLPERDAGGPVLPPVTRGRDLPVKQVGDYVDILPPTEPRTKLEEPDDGHRDSVDSATDNHGGVVVRGPCKPVFARNSISSSVGNGVMLLLGAGGDFDANKFFQCRGFGVSCEDDGTAPQFRGNTFVENTRGGLRLRESCSGLVKGNHFFENRGPQILVLRGCDDVVVRKNEVYSGSRIGVVVRERGAGMFEDNLFRDCHIAVRLDSDSNPIFRRNFFRSCGVGALCVRWSLGVFDDNQFSSNRGACIVVGTHANPVVSHCRLGSSEHGVIVQHRGRGRFDANQIKDNNAAQIVVRDHADPVFTNNFIADGKEEGAVLFNYGRGTFRHNFFCGHVRAHIHLRSFANPLIEDNLLLNSGSHGIACENSALGVITGNAIERNKGDGVVVGSGAAPVIRGNLVHNNTLSGLHLAHECEGVFEKNELYGNAGANVLVTGEVGAVDPVSALPTVRRNWICDGSGAGIMVSTYGRCALLENYISGNAAAALRVSSHAFVFCAGNHFHRGGEGVVVTEDCACIVARNVFDRLRLGLSLLSGAPCVALWNVFKDCDVALQCEGGSGRLFENVFSRCRLGVLFGRFSRSTFAGNVLAENALGATLKHRSKADLQDNIFTRNKVGVASDGDNSSVVELNCFAGEREAGVLSQGGGNFLHNCFIGSPVNVQADGCSATSKFSSSWIVGCVGVICAHGARCKFDDVFVSACVVGIASFSASDSTFTGGHCQGCKVGVGCHGAGGTFESVHVTENHRNIITSAAASPSFLSCLVDAAELTNVLVDTDGAGSWQRCVIRQSRRACGVVVLAGGAPRMEQCLLADHRAVSRQIPQQVVLHAAALGVGTMDKRGSRKGSATPSQLSDVPLPDAVLATFPTLSQFLVPEGSSLHSGHAIVCFGTSQAVLSRCVVKHNSAGLKIMSQAAPTVERCVFASNDSAGVLFEEGSKGTLGWCTFPSVHGLQVVVEGRDAAPVVHDNTFPPGGSFGIQVLFGASPEIKGNTFNGLLEGGVQCDSHSQPNIHHNTFIECPDAVSFAGGARGVAEGNRIWGSTVSGIYVSGSGTAPSISDNDIWGCTTAVTVVGGASPVMQCCRWFRCGDGVATRGSSVLIRECTAARCKRGIVLEDESTGTIEQCTLFDMADAGMDIGSHSTPLIKGNAVYEAPFGIRLRGSSGRVEGNRVFECRDCGVLLTGAGCDAHVVLNDVEGCASGIGARAGATGLVEHNCVADNRRGIEISDASTSVQQNFLRENGTGLYCADEASPVVGSNVIARSRSDGIVVATKATPELAHNVVLYSKACGLVATTEARGTTTGSLFCDSGEAGIRIERGAAPTVTDSLVCDGGKVGVHVRDGGLGVMQQLHVCGALDQGILVESGCAPEFRGTVLVDLRTGVAVSESGNSVHDGTYVIGCGVGFHISDGEALLRECEVKECGVAFTCGGGKPRLVDCTANHSKTGLHIPRSVRTVCVVEGAHIYRCKTALLAEGKADISNCELNWNTDGIVVVDGQAQFRNNTIYDNGASGVIVRGGSPRVVANTVFDNSFASLLLEGGEPVVEENRFYFPRDSGAIVNHIQDQAKLARNIERNAASPPFDRSSTDRQLAYNQMMRADFERSLPSFRKMLRVIESKFKRGIDRCLETARSAAPAAPSGLVVSPLHLTFDFIASNRAHAPVTSLTLHADPVRPGRADHGRVRTEYRPIRAFTRIVLPAVADDKAAVLQPRPPGKSVSRRASRVSVLLEPVVATRGSKPRASAVSIRHDSEDRSTTPRRNSDRVTFTSEAPPEVPPLLDSLAVRCETIVAAAGATTARRQSTAPRRSFVDDAKKEPVRRRRSTVADSLSPKRSSVTPKPPPPRRARGSSVKM